MRLKRKNFRSGFTLVEMLVVLVILGIVAALSITTMLGFMERGRQVSRSNIARTIYLAAQNQLAKKNIEKSLKAELTGHYFDADGNVIPGLNNVAAKLGGEFPEHADESKRKAVHYISMPANYDSASYNPDPAAYADENDANIAREIFAFYNLLDEVIIDKEILTNAILMEYNVETGVVLSVFYSEQRDESGEFEFDYLDTDPEDTDPKNIFGGRGGGGYPHADKRNQGYYGVTATGELPELISWEFIDIFDGTNRALRVDVGGGLVDLRNVLYAEILVPVNPASGYPDNYEFSLVNIGGAELGTPKEVNNWNQVEARVLSGFIGNPQSEIYFYEDMGSHKKYIWILDYAIGDIYERAPDAYINTIDPQNVFAKAERDILNVVVPPEISPMYAHSHFALQIGASSVEHIRSARHLKNIFYLPDGDFIQHEDIDMRESIITSISNFAPIPTFSGSYDGNGMEISNLIFDDIGKSLTYRNIGLFGEIRGNESDDVDNIVNLSLINPEIISSRGTNIGVVAGVLTDGGTIVNSSSVTSGASLRVNATEDGVNVGGLVGSVSGGSLNGCFNAVAIDVIGKNVNVGGLVGSMLDGEISECFNGTAEAALLISVNGEGANVGGLVGLNGNGGTISISYNYSNVASFGAGSSVGGLAGLNAAESEINQSFNAGFFNAPEIADEDEESIARTADGVGSVTSTAHGRVGGLVGTNFGIIRNSFNNARVNIESTTVDLEENTLSDAPVPMPMPVRVTLSPSRELFLGGIAGRNEGRIENSYATNFVGFYDDEENAFSGGIKGNPDGGTIVNSFFIMNAPESEKDPDSVSKADLRGNLSALGSAYDISAEATPIDNLYSNYPYPFLRDNPFIDGDEWGWEDIFYEPEQTGEIPPEPALLYHEIYNDNSLTFYGFAEPLRNAPAPVTYDGYVLDFGDYSRGYTLALGSPPNRRSYNISVIGGVWTVTDSSGIAAANWLPAEDRGNRNYLHIPNSIATASELAGGGNITLALYAGVNAGEDSTPIATTAVFPSSFNPLFPPVASGSTSTPVRSPRHIRNIRYALNNNYTQQLDIDFSIYRPSLNTLYRPNTADSSIREFTGAAVAGMFGSGRTYDGAGKEIRTLRITSGDNVGLFHTNAGTVKNVRLTNANITGGSTAGGIAGTNSGTIENAQINTSIISGSSFVGGLAGVNSGKIENSQVNTSGITGSSVVGGIAGENNNNIKDSGIDTTRVSGSTSAGGYSVGGIAGDNSGDINSCIIQSRISSGDHVVVRGFKDVGGIAGVNSSSGTLIHCTVMVDTSAARTIAVLGDENIGGIAGTNNNEVDFCSVRTSISRISAINYSNDPITARGRINVGGIAGVNNKSVTNVYLVSNSNTAAVQGTGTGTALNPIGGIAGMNNSPGIVDKALYLARLQTIADGQHLAGRSSTGAITNAYFLASRLNSDRFSVNNTNTIEESYNGVIGAGSTRPGRKSHEIYSLPLWSGWTTDMPTGDNALSESALMDCGLTGAGYIYPRFDRGQSAPARYPVVGGVADVMPVRMVYYERYAGTNYVGYWFHDDADRLLYPNSPDLELYGINSNDDLRVIEDGYLVLAVDLKHSVGIGLSSRGNVGETGVVSVYDVLGSAGNNLNGGSGLTLVTNGDAFYTFGFASNQESQHRHQEHYSDGLDFVYFNISNGTYQGWINPLYAKAIFPSSNRNTFRRYPTAEVDNNPNFKYSIRSARHLENINNRQTRTGTSKTGVSGNFVQELNIDLNGYTKNYYNPGNGNGNFFFKTTDLFYRQTSGTTATSSVVTGTFAGSYTAKNNHHLYGEYVSKIYNSSSANQITSIFENIGSTGRVENLRLEDNVIGRASTANASLAVTNSGTIRNIQISNTTVGTATSTNVGGLVSTNNGTISDVMISNTTVASSTAASDSANTGGAVANNTGTISNVVFVSDASAPVTGANAGGITGNNSGTVRNAAYIARAPASGGNIYPIARTVGESSAIDETSVYYLYGTHGRAAADNNGAVFTSPFNFNPAVNGGIRKTTQQLNHMSNAFADGWHRMVEPAADTFHGNLYPYMFMGQSENAPKQVVRQDGSLHRPWPAATIPANHMVYYEDYTLNTVNNNPRATKGFHLAEFTGAGTHRLNLQNDNPISATGYWFIVPEEGEYSVKSENATTNSYRTAKKYEYNVGDDKKIIYYIDELPDGISSSNGNLTRVFVNDIQIEDTETRFVNTLFAAALSSSETANRFEIRTPLQMANISMINNSAGARAGIEFAQTRPIDFNNIPYTTSVVRGVFRGEYNGNNNIITGLNINAPTLSNIGLFSINNGTIRNVRLQSSSAKPVIIRGMNNVGGIVGNNEGVFEDIKDGETVVGREKKGGFIYNCSVESTRGAADPDSYEGFVIEAVGRAGNETAIPPVPAIPAENAGGIAGVNSGRIDNFFVKFGVIRGDASVGAVVGLNTETGIIFIPGEPPIDMDSRVEEIRIVRAGGPPPAKPPLIGKDEGTP